MSDNTSDTVKQIKAFIARWDGHGGIAEYASNLMGDAADEIALLRAQRDAYAEEIGRLKQELKDAEWVIAKVGSANGS